MTQILYVHAHPSREQFANGYAAGLNRMCDEDEVQYEVVLNALCPHDRLYIRDTRDFYTDG